MLTNINISRYFPQSMYNCMLLIAERLLRRIVHKYREMYFKSEINANLKYLFPYKVFNLSFRLNFEPINVAEQPIVSILAN